MVSAPRSTTRRPMQSSGLTGNPLLDARSTPNGNILSRLVRGGAHDALNIALSTPQMAQLVAMNLISFNPVSGPAGVASSLGAGQIPGMGWLGDLQAETMRANKAAVKGTAEDYNQFYVQPIRSGDWGRLGNNVIDHPVRVALDLAMAKGAVGRAPAAATKAQIRMAPNSARSARARQRMSSLSAEDRLWANEVENAARAGRGKAPLPFAEGQGGLYRPPIIRRSVIADPTPGRQPIAHLEVTQHRPGYSPDFITRARQKAVDRARDRVGSKVRGGADKLQKNALDSQGAGRRVVSALASPFRTEGKTGRVVQGQVLDLSNRRISQSEALAARNLVGGNGDVGLDRALARLKKDRGAAGIPVRQDISIEQMATTMRWEGITSVKARDIAVRRYEGEIKKLEKAGRFDDVRARQAQVEIVKRIPPELIELTDTANPAVRRVLDAVNEGKRVGKVNQDQSVAAGVVTREVADAMTTRSSTITAGGSRWWQDAVREVSRQMNPKIKGIKKRALAVRQEARAAREAGDIEKAGRLYAEARRLDSEAAKRVAAKREKIAKIKEGATTETPRLASARESFAESNRRLSEAKQVGTPAEIARAALDHQKYMRRLRKQEMEHLGFTKPRRPELVDEGVYRTARNVRPSERPSGAQARAFGPERATRDQGRLRQSMGFDARPNLMLHQTARSADNYVGKMSNQALEELVDTIGYRVPGSKGKDGREMLLTGNRKAMESAAATGRVGFIHKDHLRRAIDALDDLKANERLPREMVDRALSEILPADAKASDYIAVHADGLRIWKDAMYEPNKVLRYADNTLTFWKGGLLALMPRWYINNTFGLALQYGLLSGGDMQAVFMGNKREIRAAMEKRAPQAVRDTFGRDNPGSTPDWMASLFRVNTRLEEIWRRAAYLNRSKKLLGTEGVRYSRLTEQELARALETMPESMVRSIVRDVDFFIGNYTKFRPVERKLIKRFVPFYSWLRVISRLTFGLPFRSPTRAAALQLLSKAAIAGLDPQSQELPWYMRSAFVAGDKRIVANAANPAATLAGPIAALGGDNAVGSTIEEGLAWTHPGIGFLATQGYGVTPFGSRVQGAPGAAPFGRGPSFFNTVTGDVDRSVWRIPTSDALLGTVFPAQSAFAKKALAPEGMIPLDTTTTKQVVDDWARRQAGERGNDKLYRKVKRGGGLTPLTGRGWRIFGGATGFNVYRMDQAAITREYRKRLRDQVAEARKRERATG